MSETDPDNQKGFTTSLLTVADTSPKSPKSPPAVFCTAKADIERIANQVLAADRIALDIETYGPNKGDALNPWRGDMRLLTIRVANGPATLLDLRAIGYDLGTLASALEQVEIIGHNLRFDLLWLQVKCGINPRRVFCTCTASRLLSAGMRERHDLGSVLDRHLGVTLGPDLSTSEWGDLIITEAQVAYAAADVENLQALAGKLRTDLDAAGLGRTAELEMNLLPVVVEMEHARVRVDREALMAIKQGAIRDTQAKTCEIHRLLGAPNLNVSSPIQLLAALTAAGINAPNTKEDTLNGIHDNTGAVAAILAFRRAEKLAQQPETLLKAIGPDGRIHGQFNPTGTDTGRFSSSGPNLQNIARGPIRSAFVPESGSRFIVADYSQIELRIAGVVANDQRMLGAYRLGADLHQETAAAILGKRLDEVTKADRQLAKAVNFGLLYGQGAKGLVRYAAASYGLSLTEQEAERLRSRFFKTYHGLSEWHARAWRSVRAGFGSVTTKLGRRRLIPKDSSDWMRFTSLVNTEVQGGAADGMKLAMVALAGQLPERARLVSTVHDELILEAPEGDAAQVANLTKVVMIESMAGLYPEVPIEVEVAVCESWAGKGG